MHAVSWFLDTPSVPREGSSKGLVVPFYQTLPRRGRRQAPKTRSPTPANPSACDFRDPISCKLTVATPRARSSRSKGGLMNRRATTRMLIEIRIRHKPKPFAMRIRPPWSVGVTTAMGGEIVDIAALTTRFKHWTLHVRADRLEVEHPTPRHQAIKEQQRGNEELSPGFVRGIILQEWTTRLHTCK